ncbi:19993_t:CDS:2, partial [Gigaspora rosea]
GRAEAQAKFRAKKLKQINEGVVEQYDTPRRPPVAILYPDLWDKIHDSKIGLASVARTDMKPHIDEHYCLASVKVARVFTEVFAKDSIIISQNNKAKVGLGVPAV